MSTLRQFLRIFVVDDHDDTLTTLRNYLERSGYLVFSACSKSEALKQIPTANCDVLISDISLPDGNGWDLIREVGKSRPAYTIAMSGYGMKADRERSVDAGFRHHLVKPVMPEKLSNLLEQAIVELQARK